MRRLALWVTFIALIFFFVSCAPVEQRYLTQDEDAALKEQCEKYQDQGGCLIVPAPVMKKLLDMLRGKYA